MPKEYEPSFKKGSHPPIRTRCQLERTQSGVPRCAQYALSLAQRILLHTDSQPHLHTEGI